MFTIQCRLCASEETRRDFWQWMEKYTLLVNELLEQIPQHPQFQEWQKKGNISRKEVREKILAPLKENLCYGGLPGRFYTSAELICCDTYKSWLALQKERQLRLTGKERWLHAIESEFELSATTDFNADEIRAKARDIQNKAIEKLNKQGRKPKELMGILLDMHKATAQDPLSRRAINYLLINELQVTDEQQSLDKLSERFAKKRVEIRRIEEQLKSRQPKGRDPTGQRYLQSLCNISVLPELSHDPEKLEAELSRLTIQQQLPLLNELPYPIRFDSSGDLYWSVETQDTSNSSGTVNKIHQEPPKAKKLRKKRSKQAKERICVEFNGVKGYIFKIQCDRRQLPLFRRFLSDYQTNDKLPDEEHFSEGLFTLRSASLIWRKDDKRPDINKRRNKRKNIAIDKQENQLKPWNTHLLCLHCTVGRPLLTAEGTEQVREEKKNEVLEELKGKEKLQESELHELGLNKNQISYVKRRCSTLNRLENNSPPPRPSTQPYEGQPHIVVGVSFSGHEPVTLAVVDDEKEEVLECQSTKDLLNRGKAQHICRRGKKELLQADSTERQHPNGGKLYIRKRKCVQWKPYRLVQLLHRRHQHNARRRTQAQKQNRYRRGNSDSNLGLYVDRLIASRIVDLAVKRKAGTIAVPQLKGFRENIESYIRAQAELKFPNDKERQKEYAKHYRASFPWWSYQRLSECIKECATREGIAVIIRKQPFEGDMEQKAIAIALPSYKVKTS